MADADRIAAALRYQQEQQPADPLESFRSLAGLKGAYERRVQPIINNAAQTFSTGGVIGDLLRSYGEAAAPAQAAVLKGMGMPYQGPMTAPREEGVTSGESFRPMGDSQQQFLGQLLGDPTNLAPLAGPAVKGAAALGRYAGPELARGLESYAGRTGMRLNAVPELSTIRLFHRSPQENLVEVDKSGRFGGIFAGSDPESAIGLSPRKTFLHYADVPENSIADSSALINASENKINVSNNAIKNSINPKYHQQENIDVIKDLALNDINIFKMIDPETNKPTKELQTILKSLGTDDLGEASWELQKIRGSIAKDLGFKAVTMSDEQGLSYFLTPGTKLKAGKGE